MNQINLLFAGLFLLVIVGFGLVSYQLDGLSGRGPAGVKAINDYTNNSVRGVYFPGPSFSVYLDRDNEEGLKGTVNHEFLHHLILSDDGCGAESCRDHFCGGFS